MFPWSAEDLSRKVFNSNQQNKLLNRRTWKMHLGSMRSTMITKPDCTPALEFCKSNVLTSPNTRVEGTQAEKGYLESWDQGGG